jgi:hypothetical protein
MFEGKPQTSNQEAIVEKIDVTLFRAWCRAIGIPAGEIAHIMNAADEPADATRSHERRTHLLTAVKRVGVRR